MALEANFGTLERPDSQFESVELPDNLQIPTPSQSASITSYDGKPLTSGGIINLKNLTPTNNGSSLQNNIENITNNSNFNGNIVLQSVDDSIIPVKNNFDVSKSDSYLNESLYTSFERIKNLNIRQQTEIINSININSPLLINNENSSNIYQDIYGNEYERNVFYKDGSYFGLTCCVYIHSYTYDTEGNYTYNDDYSNFYFAPINKHDYDIFKLKQNIFQSSYFVYAFTDITTGEISYNKYFGDVKYVNDIPIGENIPKIINGETIQTIDLDSVILNTYTVSAFENGKNIILEELSLPRIKFTLENDKILYDYSNDIDISFNKFSIKSYCNSKNDDNSTPTYISLGLPENSNADSTIDNLYTVLKNLIQNYSLYSEINILQKSNNEIILKPITLYIPKYIYTAYNNSTYEYNPYEITTYNSDKIILVNKDNGISFNNITTNFIDIFTQENKIELYNTDWYKFYSQNGLDIYVNKTKLTQDENFNYTEVIDNEKETKTTTNNIINFLIQNKEINALYTTKIRVQDIPVQEYLYTYNSVNINEPILEYANMSYMDFLSKMTTAYNLPYIESFSYKYYQQVGQNPLINYVSDVLYAQNGIEVSYSYWSPELSSYSYYFNKILEYNGNFYGSDIFESNFFNDKINVFTYDSHTCTTKFNDYDIQLTEVFFRSKLNEIDDNGNELNIYNAQNNINFIKDNNEITYNTYLAIPFELKNQTELEFSYEYEFVPPKQSYLVTSTDIEIKRTVKNPDANIKNNEQDDCFTYTLSYSLKVQQLDSGYYVIDSFVINTVYTYNIENYSYIDININENENLVSGLTSNESSNSFTNSLWKINTYKLKDISESLKDLFGNTVDLNTIAIFTYDGSSNDNELQTIEKFFTITETDLDQRIKQDSKKIKFDWEDKDITVITADKYFKLNIHPNIKIELKESDSKSIENATDKFKNSKYELTYELITKTTEGQEIGFSNSNFDSETGIYSANKEYHIIYSYVANGKSYTYSSIIINDGYWKRNYNEVIKPFINVTYSYASNSVDISNAYIVPTTKNERLGFIKQNKVAYNVFTNSYVEKHIYTYIDEHNVQKLFDETIPGALVIQSDDKFYGIQKVENPINQKLIKINGSSKLEIYNETKYVVINIFDENKGNSNDDNIVSSTNINEIDDEQKNKILTEFIKFCTKQESEINKIYLKKDGNLKFENNVIEYNLDTFSINNQSSEYIDFEYKGKRYSLDIMSTTLSVTFINEMIELHKRLTISQEQKIEEVVVQEEELISQNAKIDTPFGIVNGKKVVVTDEVYIPETYVTITTIDPETYNYVSYEVIATEPYYAYSYEVEDIPFTTASYLYTDSDGIKIQGLDSLIEVLANNLGIATPNPILESLKDKTSSKSSTNNDQWLKKIHGTLLSYMSLMNDSLSYIDNLYHSISKIPQNFDMLSYNISNNKEISKLTRNLSYNNDKLILAESKNTTNLINAQKTIFGKISDSISKQTTTLSKLILASSGKETSEILTNDLFNDFTPQNWNTISMIGYEYSYESFVNAYKPIGYKYTKIIGRNQYAGGYVTRTGTYNLEEPKSIYFSYSNFIDSNMSSIERIGLRLNKETRDFSYNGYVYRQDIYSYQNLADILSDLHVSNRLPTRKEFIVDVSKRLYINSDFIFAYTSPNEYAVRAIYRADVLWSELAKAGIVENNKITKKDIPEEILNRKEEKNKWWKDENKLNKFVNKFNLDKDKLKLANEKVFIDIEKQLSSNQTNIDELIEEEINYNKTVKLIIKTNIDDYIIDYLYYDSCGEIDCRYDEYLYETPYKGETVKIGVMYGNKSGIYEFVCDGDITIDNKEAIEKIMKINDNNSKISNSKISTVINKLIPKQIKTPLYVNLNKSLSNDYINFTKK